MIDEGNRCKQRNIILGNGKKKPKVQALYDYAEKSNREVSPGSKVHFLINHLKLGTAINDKTFVLKNFCLAHCTTYDK